MSVKKSIDEILGLSEENSTEDDPSEESSGEETQANTVETPSDAKLNGDESSSEASASETAELDAADKSSGEHTEFSPWIRFDIAAKRYSKAIDEFATVDAKKIIKELKTSHINMSADMHDLSDFNDRIQLCQSMRDRVSQIYLDIFPLAETVSQGMKTLMIYGQKFSSESSDKKREADIIDRLEQLELSYMIDLNGELSMLCDTIQWTYKNLSGVHETLSRQITIWQERNRNDINRGANPSMYNDKQAGGGKSPLESLRDSGNVGKHKQVEVDKSKKPGTVSWGEL